MNISKEQVVQDVINLVNQEMYDEAEKYVELVKESVLNFEETKDLLEMIPRKKISMICIDCEEEYINNTIMQSNYGNIEQVNVHWNEDSLEDVLDYIYNTDSEYICFVQPNQVFSKDRLIEMSKYLRNNKSTDACICSRNYVDNNGNVMFAPSKNIKGLFEKVTFNGKDILEMCIDQKVNLYGCLSTLMIRTSSLVKDDCILLKYNKANNLKSLILNYILLYNKRVSFIESELVSSYFESFDEETLKAEYEEYNEYLKYLATNKLLEVSEGQFLEQFYQELLFEGKKEDVKKEITFFYTDKGEYYNLEPIEKEAIKRGYKTKFTDIIDEKAEIGVYCQHFCYPENSKFSLILLHDMAQGHNRWPDIWNVERWNGFDIGILPGVEWKERWLECSALNHTLPKKGTFMFGYPKSDYVGRSDIIDRAKQLKDQFGLKYDYTVLYAPSWENDFKEDDFIRALASLKVNLLIKQAHWPKQYQFVIDDIEQMRQIHENKYDNLYYIEPEESILVALEMCDLVVSDESSVMTEAMLFGVPSIAVVDWLIPDSNPKRFASVPFEYVYRCRKVELREYVEKIKSGEFKDIDVNEERSNLFYNMGNCNKSIMDAVDYYIDSETSNESDFLKYRVMPKYMPVCLWR